MFKDPLPGTVKECWYMEEINTNYAHQGEWETCAKEHGKCFVKGEGGIVRFGQGNTWVYVKAAGSISCTDGYFGDPMYGTVKKCEHQKS